MFRINSDSSSEKSSKNFESNFENFKDFENNLSLILEKLKLYFECKEYVFAMRYLNDNFHEFLPNNPEIRFSIYFFEFIKVIEEDSDPKMIENYIQHNFINQFSSLPDFNKKMENIYLLTENKEFLISDNFKRIIENNLINLLNQIEFELNLHLTQNYHRNTSAFESSDNEICDYIRNTILTRQINDNDRENNYFESFLNFINQKGNEGHDDFVKQLNPILSKSKSKKSKEMPSNESNKVSNLNNQNSIIIEEFDDNVSVKTTSTNLTKRESMEFGNNEVTEDDFLKEFKQKFIKRDIIDKKILRKFKKFLKKNYNKILKKLGENKKFWIIFVKDNIFPPMKLLNDELNINVEFKSFNIKYINWLFSQQGSHELYNKFVNEEGEELYNKILESISNEPKNKKDLNKFKEKLRKYIYEYPIIFSPNKSVKNQSCFLPPVSAIPIGKFNENLLQEIYGYETTKKKEFLSVNRERINHIFNDDYISDGDEQFINDLFQNSFSDINNSNLTPLFDNQDQGFYNE